MTVLTNGNFARTSTFNSQLIDISDCNTLQQVHDKTNTILNPIEKVELYQRTSYEDLQEGNLTGFNQFPNTYGLRDSITKTPYGVCSSSYKIIQNKTAFDALDQIVTSGDGEYSKVGLWNGGSSAFISIKRDRADLPEPTDERYYTEHQINKADMKTPETIDNFIFALNDHGGNYAVNYGTHALRMYCLNQLPHMYNWLNNQTKFRHTESAELNVRGINNLMRSADTSFAQTIQAYQSLQIGFMTTRQFKVFAAQLLEDIWPGGLTAKINELVRTKDYQPTYKMSELTDHRYDQVRELSYNFDSNKQQADWTRWGALQVVTAWRDHDPRKQFKTNIRGIGAKFKDRAIEMLTERPGCGHLQYMSPETAM